MADYSCNEHDSTANEPGPFPVHCGAICTGPRSPRGQRSGLRSRPSSTSCGAAADGSLDPAIRPMWRREIRRICSSFLLGRGSKSSRLRLAFQPTNVE